MMSRSAKYGFLTAYSLSSILNVFPVPETVCDGSKPSMEYRENFPSSPSDSKRKQVSKRCSIFWNSSKKSTSCANFVYVAFWPIFMCGIFSIELPIQSTSLLIEHNHLLGCSERLDLIESNHLLGCSTQNQNRPHYTTIHCAVRAILVAVPPYFPPPPAGGLRNSPTPRSGIGYLVHGRTRLPHAHSTSSGRAEAPHRPQPPAPVFLKGRISIIQNWGWRTGSQTLAIKQRSVYWASCQANWTNCVRALMRPTTNCFEHLPSD